jgi:hypothetical protein
LYRIFAEFRLKRLALKLLDLAFRRASLFVSFIERLAFDVQQALLNGHFTLRAFEFKLMCSNTLFTVRERLRHARLVQLERRLLRREG